MRRIRPFIRDVELHGHHRLCPVEDCEDEGECRPCTCAQLDLDDYYDAGDRAYHEMIENPKEVEDE